MRGPWAGTALRPLTVTASPEQRARRSAAAIARYSTDRSTCARPTGAGRVDPRHRSVIAGCRVRHVAAATRPLLDPPDRCPFSAADRLRGERTRRSGLARWQICGFSFGSRRADGRLGDSGRNREFLQPDPGGGEGHRQFIAPHAWLLPRREPRDVLETRGRFDGHAHQHLGGTGSRRAAAALPRRCGGIRLDRRRGASGLPHPRPGRSHVRPRCGQQAEARPIFTASPGRHSHYPIWAPDQSFVYFVQLVEGAVPERMDIWRIRPTGGIPERITHHDSRVTHPVFVGAQTLAYLASDADGSGPWLHTLDVRRRVPHRVSVGLESYSSLAATTDGRRLVASLTRRQGALWRLPITDDSNRIVGRAPHPADHRKRIVSAAGPRLPPLCLFQRGQRQHLEAPG